MTQIVRLDDFPTGVRPLADLSNQRRIMDAFEQRKILFHVGIVPKLLNESHSWLRDYSYLIPCQHGYDHQYPKYSALLTKDPKNHNTVGSFDEFENVPYTRVHERIYQGKRILERFFKKDITTYIPVCNITNRYLARVLKFFNYKTILTESPVAGLPCIKSDFYGRLHELTGNPNVTTLHLTWECDYIEEHGWDAWKSLFDAWTGRIAEQRPRDPLILFKMASRSRPKKVIEILNLYYDMMAGRDFKFVLTLDEDDPTVTKSFLTTLGRYANLEVKIGKSRSKIEAMNADVPEDGWDIIVLVSDDMIPKVKGFDNVIREEMLTRYPDYDGVLWFNDGYQKTDVNTLSIMGRPYYQRFGYLYHPEYMSQRCDVEFQEVADGLKRQTYIDRVIIRHEHYSNGHGRCDALLSRNMRHLNHDALLFSERKKMGFPRGIPHIANFYWNAETPLSYLRYLTLWTFRHHHPDWTMKLYTGSSNITTQWGGTERQDFAGYAGKDWMSEVAKLGVQLDVFDRPDLNPNYVSDVFRWDVLRQGGWYLDMDQIFTGNFDKISRENDVVYGGKKHKYCGVIGACYGSEVIKKMAAVQAERIGGIKNYCDIGNWLWTEVVTAYSGQDKILQTDDRVFYPVTDSHMIKAALFSGQTDISKIGGLATHWFGGHPDCQEFNKTFDGSGNDSISNYIRTLKNKKTSP